MKEGGEGGTGKMEYHQPTRKKQKKKNSFCLFYISLHTLFSELTLFLFCFPPISPLALSVVFCPSSFHNTHTQTHTHRNPSHRLPTIWLTYIMPVFHWVFHWVVFYILLFLSILIFCFSYSVIYVVVKHFILCNKNKKSYMLRVLLQDKTIHTGI